MKNIFLSGLFLFCSLSSIKAQNVTKDEISDEYFQNEYIAEVRPIIDRMILTVDKTGFSKDYENLVKSGYTHLVMRFMVEKLNANVPVDEKASVYRYAAERDFQLLYEKMGIMLKFKDEMPDGSRIFATFYKDISEVAVPFKKNGDLDLDSIDIGALKKFADMKMRK